MWVVPRFLLAARRLRTRQGSSAPEGNLERQRSEVDVIVAAAAGMEVDVVVADAHGVEKLSRLDLRAGLAGDQGPVLPATVLFEDGEDGPDSPRLADVRELGQPVLGADKIAPQAQPGPAGAAVGAGCFGLEPVEQRQAELLGPVGMALAFFRGAPDEIAQEVIVLGPVDKADVGRVGARGKVVAIGDAAILPEVEGTRLGLAVRSEAEFFRFESGRVAVGEIEQVGRAMAVPSGERGLAKSRTPPGRSITWFSPSR